MQSPVGRWAGCRRSGGGCHLEPSTCARDCSQGGSLQHVARVARDLERHQRSLIRRCDRAAADALSWAISSARLRNADAKLAWGGVLRGVGQAACRAHQPWHEGAHLHRDPRNTTKLGVRATWYQLHHLFKSIDTLTLLAALHYAAPVEVHAPQSKRQGICLESCITKNLSWFALQCSQDGAIANALRRAGDCLVACSAALQPQRAASHHRSPPC